MRDAARVLARSVGQKDKASQRGCEKCSVEFIPHEICGVWNEFHTTSSAPNVRDSIFSQPQMDAKSAGCR